MDTLLHELGHGVYDTYFSPDLPWLLRIYPHLISTESMALMMGAFATDPVWLTQIRGTSAEEVAGISEAVSRYERRRTLIFARWVMVMVNFERAMYEDPDRDLDTLWWDLVEKYQFVHRPEDRKMPDWATKYHVALAPAYYQNYLLGQMMSIQWEHHVQQQFGGLINCREAGEFLKERVFKIGATYHWNDALEYATGEKLNIRYYVEKYVSNG
jgi:peptidyl-dipeptidase A